MKTTWAQGDQLTHGALVLAPEGADLARELVSVGTPVENTQVRLMGGGGIVVSEEDTVGEIQVRGASVMRGYERDEPATRDSINDEGWLSTGDLGFRHDGELFVTGRKKEIIIVLGQNYYASDIESIAGSVPGVANHGVLAASIRYADGEGLVLFVETRETEHTERAKLVTQVRHAVSSGLGVVPQEVILLRRGKLPRTSSGKLERHGLEALYSQHASYAAASERMSPMAMTRK
jgi:acyl-CoA synthetase (AMP-forming)/AMP-acid ligase II